MKRLQSSFNDKASVNAKLGPTAPFSMRLSAEERAFLDQHCDGRPWAAYIRECVFGEQANRIRQRRPKIHDQNLVKALSGLGQSRISSNLNQIAKMANYGYVDVSPETEAQLRNAAEAILAMRQALIAALGLKSRR